MRAVYLLASSVNRLANACHPFTDSCIKPHRLLINILPPILATLM